MVTKEGSQKVFLGSTKMDKARRISLIKIVADRLEAVDGDFIMFFYDTASGNIVIQKSNKDEPVQILSDKDKEEVMDKSDIIREIIKEFMVTETLDDSRFKFDGTLEEFEEAKKQEKERLDRYEKKIDDVYQEFAKSKKK